MATRSTLARRIGTGVQSIYIHHDGYPFNMSALLADFYTDPTKIDAIFELGDLSSLGASVEYTGPIGTVAYGRDYGEKRTEANLHANVSEWFSHRRIENCEYGYYWAGHRWLTLKLDDDTEQWVTAMAEAGVAFAG
jgi:hypothetical protein